MANKPFTIQVDENALADFEKVSAGVPMDATKFASLIIGKFAGLSPEYGLDALTSIPKEFFRRRPGRPPATPRLAEAEHHVSAEHVRE